MTLPPVLQQPARRLEGRTRSGDGNGIIGVSTIDRMSCRRITAPLTYLESDSRIQMKTTLIVLAALAWSLSASAKVIPGDTMQCTVTGVYNTDDNGKLKSLVSPRNMFRDALGSQFTLDRSTGLMRGRLIDNHDVTYTVLDYGDTDGTSYKAFARNQSGHLYVQLIQVDTWADGERKPFRYMDTMYIAVGYCS